MIDLLSDLNEPQRQAVQHMDGPLLVLAGAGSGKTRVITRRVAWLVQQGVDPWHILAITFTNKAAGEMRQRVADLNTPNGAMVCTFHALCARLLREFAEQAGLDPRFTIFDRDDQLKIAKQALEKANTSASYLTPAKLHAAISNAKNALQSPRACADQASDHYARSVAAGYLQYEKLLRENNGLDFDDLLMRMAAMLRDNANVREFLTTRYRYVLIDEYQDTNHAQYVIAHSIAVSHENICATGDPDQSIYAWRGADINNILDFEKDYPNAVVIRLEENYRSVQPILTAASSLIAHNVSRKDKTLFTRKTDGRPVRVVHCDDEHAEARYLAQAIDQYRLDGGSYSDIAVFYRVNSLSRVLEESLLRKGVPYAIARGVEFYNRKEIRDLLAYLKLLNNPADSVSCARIINTPTRGIGATTVKRLAAWADARSMSLLEATKHIDEVGLSAGPTKKVRAFAEMMNSFLPAPTPLEQAAGEEASPAFAGSVRLLMEQVYRKSGLEAMHSTSDEDARQAKANVEELLNTAYDFDAENPDAGLNEYLEQISLVSDADHMQGASGAVTLMTLHAAKGLEFPVVFMVGCEDGLLPFHRSSSGFNAELPLHVLEEERRLAFVGMTRAQEQLTLTCAQRRQVRGRWESQIPSGFLDEIGEENVERLDQTSKTPTRTKHRGGFFRESFNEPSRVREKIETFDLDAINDFGDDIESPIPPEFEYLRPGCMVRHPRFGLGKLTKMSRSWPETRVTVLFAEVGTKKLVLALSGLEPADDY